MKKLAYLIYVGIKKILPAVYFMYLFSMVISMAGMEIFGWSGIFLTIYILVYDLVVNKEDIFVRHPLNKWFLILACALAISVLSSPLASEAHIGKLYYLGRIRNLIFFSYHLIIFERIFSYQRALKTLLYFMLPIVLYALLQKFTGFDPITGNWKMHLSMFNSYSMREVFNMYLTYVNVFQFHFFIILSFVVLGKMGSKLRFFLISLAILLLASFIFSGGRAIIVAISIGFIVQLFISYRKLPYIIALLAIMAGSYIAFKTSPYAMDKVKLTINDRNQLGDDWRFHFWKTHLAMFKDHPIKGVGYEMNEPLTGMYYKKLGITDPKYFAGHSHNIIVQMLAGTGLLGTIPFLILWAMIFYMSFQAFNTAVKQGDWYNTALCHGLIGGFVSFWVNGMTQWNFGDFEVTHNMMFFIAVAGYVWLKQRQDLGEKI
ncbi:MAG: O-antigen ligase family protein [bacterium]